MGGVGIESSPSARVVRAWTAVVDPPSLAPSLESRPAGSDEGARTCISKPCLLVEATARHGEVLVAAEVDRRLDDERERSEVGRIGRGRRDLNETGTFSLAAGSVEVEVGCRAIAKTRGFSEKEC